MTKEIHDINTRALDFVVELIEYIFEYPDDDYMTMECICRKLHKYGLVDKKDGFYLAADDVLRKTENSSEKPNNCEHITEDGVTCAKYPACDDCLENPLNKVKGSERLVKGSEQTDCLDRYDRKTEPTSSKMEQVDEPQTPYDNCQSCLHWVYDGYWYCECNECRYEPKDEPQTDNGIGCSRCEGRFDCYDRDMPHAVHCNNYGKITDEPQTERSE